MATRRPHPYTRVSGLAVFCGLAATVSVALVSLSHSSTLSLSAPTRTVNVPPASRSRSRLAPEFPTVPTSCRRRPGLKVLSSTRRTSNGEGLPRLLKSASAALVAAFVLADPSFAAIKKSTPILAPTAPSGIEITMDDAHGQAEILERIGKWDSDHNGRITRLEFEAGMRDYVPHELSPGQLDQAWARIQGVELERRATDPSFAGNKLTDEQKQKPQPGQPIPLPVDRVESSIPKMEGGVWRYPSPQQAYNAMVRKGKDPDIYRAKDFVSTHNEMNERGWNQVLRYESVTHPECPSKDVKLAKFNGDYDGRVEGSFDRHYWTVNRCGKEEETYVLDYFDTKKLDEITMPYSNDDIEIQVRPDPKDPNAKADTAAFKAKMGKAFSSTADPKSS